MKKVRTPKNGVVTLQQVADHIGLSAGTVSAVLNDSPAAKAIPTRTKDRILTAARELNYRPNFFARTLRNKRTFTVGVITEAKKMGWGDVKILTATPGRTANVTRLGGAAVEGLYGVGSWNVLGADTQNAEAKTFFANLKAKHNFDPDENALLAYAYTDIFVRAVEAAGKDLTPQTVASAIGTMKSANPVFYDEKSFKGAHMQPETVRIEQVKGGLWTPVSGLLQ